MSGAMENSGEEAESVDGRFPREMGAAGTESTAVVVRKQDIRNFGTDLA